MFIWAFLLLGVVCIAASFFTLRFHLGQAKKEAAIIGFCLLFLILAVTRLQVSEFAVLNDSMSILNDNSDKITLTGKIIDAPDIRETSQKLSVKIDNTQSVVLVTTSLYPEYKYLDQIKITGKLKTPFVTADFNYKNYLMKNGIYSVMDFPKIELMSNAKVLSLSESLYQKLLSFKTTLKKSIWTQFSAPHSAIIEGIMLGGTANMAEEVKEKFRATGLTHITAISGSNVVILSSILMTALLALGLWRGQAFYISIVFIWLYIVIAAFPASGIRSAIMASVFLLAQKFGRQNATARVIVLTATLMLLQNPMLLAYDVGFQLSFLASLGIIYGKPAIDYLLVFWNNQTASFFLSILSVTLAAQLFTLPIIMYYFKTISLVAPITNLLIIPIIDAVMIFGFLAAFLGIFSFGLGFIFSLPTYFIMLYFMKVVDIFGEPWAVKSINGISWVWIFIYYVTLAIIIWLFNKKVKSQFIGY